MKTKISLLLTIFFMSLFAGCEKEDEYSSESQISWVTSPTITYSYSSGVLSGCIIFRSFTVNNNKAGIIKITASTTKSEKSCEYNVEPGERYKVVIGTKIIKPYGGSTVIVNSPSLSEPWKIGFTKGEVSVRSIFIK